MVDATPGRPVAQRVLPWLSAAAWAALIFFLSSQSEPPQPATLAGLPGWSSGAHFGLYFVLGALLYWAFNGSGCRAVEDRPRAGLLGRRRASLVHGAGNGKPTGTNRYLLALAAGALYAASDEVHQYFVPRRQIDLVDWLVDIAGVLAGAFLVLAWERRNGKN